MKRICALTLAVLAGCSGHAATLVTQPLARAAIDQSVTATGNLNPQDTILVGSQVSGTVQSIYVDYNSVVHKGEVLAQLDPSTFAAAVQQGQAALESSRSTVDADEESARSSQADVASADATVRQTRAALDLAQKTYARDSALLARGFVAQSTVDADTNALQSAREGSRARNRRRSGAVRSSPPLRHRRKPASTTSRPTLFTIARDLNSMELDVSVGEPDVGALRAGQTVRFTVLAYPGRTFTGTVAQVRQNPTIVSNVTTYDTVAYIANRQGLLRPGMTANAVIVVKHYDRALIAPLAALQWRPTAAIAKAFAAKPRASAVTPGAVGRVWVKRDDGIAPIAVRILAVDGSNVAVEPVDATLDAGDALVVDVAK